MTTLAVCAIFKDEGPNLTEWVAYHRTVGVDHFFLYDNESTDDGASIVLTGPLKDYVTVIPIAGRPVQQQAYQHFMDYYASKWEWAAFIDVDEFIHPIEAHSIKDLLPRYEQYSAILLHYLVFGPNGHDSRPKGLVIENYTRRLAAQHPINRHVKSLVRTAHLIGLLGTAHVFDTKGPMCNSRGEPAQRQPIQDGVCHDVMCLNHYYIKSREDYDIRLRRGSVDLPVDRIYDPEYKIFGEYARLADVPDYRITRFADTVKSMLAGYTDLNDAVDVTPATLLPEEPKDFPLTAAPTLPEDFDSARYLALHPDVAAAGIDGRAHYLKHGFYEGRRWK